MDKIEEGGMPMAPQPPMPEMDRGDPVSMSVSLNARGKDHVEDLIDMMKNAGMSGPEEVADEPMSMRPDIERLRDIVKGKDMDDLKPGMQSEPCPKCGKVHIGMSACNDSIENDDESVIEYDNEPDEEYRDHKYMTKDLSGGINREKKAYAKAQDGDNAMAVESIKEQLYNALMAKMAEGRGRGKNKKVKEVEIQAAEGRGRGKKKK